MSALSPETLLDDDLLARLRERAADYDRRNAFFTEDLDELRERGYLRALVPTELGGLGWDLADVVRAQMRLAGAAPATALGVNMHLVWTGVARVLHDRGDASLDFVLREAADGEVFAFGISEAGNDLMLFGSGTVADPQPDGTWVCKRMTFDTTGTNGLLISPDQRTLYMIQTGAERRELRAYDILPDGSLGRYIVLHQFGEDYRGPQRGIDGMCLDAEGNIVATAGSYASGPGPMIYVWDPNGRVLETHPMPVGVDSPTNCTFGDPDQRTLYVTTAGGHLFRVRHTGRRGWIIWPPVR